jgi:hypothetical protein
MRSVSIQLIPVLCDGRKRFLEGIKRPRDVLVAVGERDTYSRPEKS